MAPFAEMRGEFFLLGRASPRATPRASRVAAARPNPYVRLPPARGAGRARCARPPPTRRCPPGGGRPLPPPGNENASLSQRLRRSARQAVGGGRPRRSRVVALVSRRSLCVSPSLRLSALPSSDAPTSLSVGRGRYVPSFLRSFLALARHRVTARSLCSLPPPIIYHHADCTLLDAFFMFRFAFRSAGRAIITFLPEKPKYLILISHLAHVRRAASRSPRRAPPPHAPDGAPAGRGSASPSPWGGGALYPVGVLACCAPLLLPLRRGVCPPTSVCPRRVGR